MPDPAAYRLPDLGEGMAEAEIIRWTVAVGDRIARDQIVVHVQTDKAEVELPAPEAGTVSRLGGEVGDLLVVGATLIEYVPDAASPAASPVASPAASPAQSATAPAAVADGAAAAAGSATAAPRTTPVNAAPPVRKLARDLGVDLTMLDGTGPDGRITAADVRAAANTPVPPATPGPPADAPAGTRREPLRGIRRAMAHNMAFAWREVPHITLLDEIDARPARNAVAAERERSGDDSLTLTALFVRAVVVALTDQPIFNAAFDAINDEIEYHESCHVGIAVASAPGLVVPVIRDAQAKTLLELGTEVNRLSSIARAGGLPPAELNGATFTITNYGTQGARFATPIVRPPQVGIFGCGAIRVRPVVDGDAVVAAPALPIALSVDHRVVDGHDATTFLDHIAQLLLEPSPLLT